MYAVGRLGSYITQGVYTVSGPFHPFGGAVDMVVVQQQDGSLKSSPWYVRFGKFQGVLKAKERVVDINVNGLDADFHMYLDPRGEAYFLREIDSEEVVETVSSHSSLHEEMNGKGQDMITVKTKSMNYDFDQCTSVNDVSNGEVLSRTNSKRSRILGFVLGRRSMKEHFISKEENNSNVGRMGSLESAEIAADLLEMRWSTNLSSRSRDSRNDNEDITGGRLEGSLVLHEQHFVNKLESSGVNHEVPAMEVKETIVADVRDINENSDEEVPSMEVKETIIADIVHDVNENVDDEVPSMEVKETIVVDVVHDVNENIDEEVPSMEVKETTVADVHNDNETVDEEGLRTQLDDSKEAEVGLITAQGSLEIVPESYTEVASNRGETSLEVVACNSIALPICQNMDDNLTKEVNETNEIRAPMNPNGEFHDVSADSVLMDQVNEEFVEEHLIFGDLDESKPSINQVGQEVKQGGSESMSITYGSDSLTVRTYQEPFKDDFETVKGNIRRCPTNLDIPKTCQVTEAEVGRQAKSLPNMWCQFNDPVPENHEESQFYSPVGKFRSSNWDLLREDASMIKKANLEKELPLHADNLSKDLKDGSISSGGAPNIVDGAGGSWRLWPFTRLGSKNVSEKEQDSKKDSVVDNLPETDGEKEEISPKSDKTHTRALTPTPEQLASLNLAEGQNSVTFTFSTSVLGPQKVDARIYLWRWDSRIVISDVDGTITKSDVLGQFMPLVGRDWSHIGVTHLFSAIKENGYQMLYLSARAISQASITRQFLFNLKQDGKALPDGPVVISPDGLFPSLFREVIRRAPHEFKIACLEDIKACFPPDRNPFYAGFGNRDTDEFSYLKVGIPKGKIFIINPKGEVVINRCIDSKSYASLHALVNGIFPPISVQEEEDYNSWNFWKLPPPTIE